MTTSCTYSELRHQVWVLWNQTHDLTEKCLDHTFAKAGLSHQQYTILLMIVCIGDPVIISDLARSLNRNVNGITMIIDRMERDGLVKRVRDLSDRRTIRLEMTQKGWQKIRQATRPGWELIERLTSSLSEEELHLSTSLLEKVKEKAATELGVEKVEKLPTKDFRKIASLLAGEEGPF